MVSTYYDGQVTHAIKRRDSWGYVYFWCRAYTAEGGPYIDWKTWFREDDVPTCFACIAADGR